MAVHEALEFCLFGFAEGCCRPMTQADAYSGLVHTAGQSMQRADLYDEPASRTCPRGTPATLPYLLFFIGGRRAMLFDSVLRS